MDKRAITEETQQIKNVVAYNPNNKKICMVNNELNYLAKTTSLEETHTMVDRLYIPINSLSISYCSSTDVERLTRRHRRR